MELANIIVLIASVITSITVISTFLLSFYKFVRKEEKWREAKDLHDNDNYLSILRLTIVSQDMPLSERIAAGDKYLKLGGNGAVKRKYQELLEQLPKED